MNDIDRFPAWLETKHDGKPCPSCGSTTKFHMVNRRYCYAYEHKMIESLQEELRAIKNTIIATIGGSDDEGNPTSEINYLQRLRHLVEIEARYLREPHL